MISPAAASTAIAAALAASSTISQLCISKWGKGCLVQNGENPADPLGAVDAPWLCVMVWPSAELGPITDAASVEILISAGVGALAADQSPALPTITTERSASANGLRTWGAPAEAEALLTAAIEAAKAIAWDDAIVGASQVESDGWLHYPLQVASAVLTIREPQTL